MKKAFAIVALSAIPAAMLSSCGQAPAASPSGPAPAITATSPSASASFLATAGIIAYQNGTYQYIGKADGEGYHVEATMVVSGGAIQSMQWKIIDTLGRVFDDKYEKIFTGNNVYIQQCRDNLSGMQGFVPELIKEQDPKTVDTVSGATWAYNKFEEAAAAMAKDANL